VTTVLLATDADWIIDEVDAALADDDTRVLRVRAGVDVLPACESLEPDLVLLDMQIGNMGGMAACMAIRHEEGFDRLPLTPVIMLLDRAADVFLARRCDADGWLVKPLDPIRLRRATAAVLAGDTWEEGVPVEPALEPADPAHAEAAAAVAGDDDGATTSSDDELAVPR
jgi:DNA-binding response OmpR family regulator